MISLYCANEEKALKLQELIIQKINVEVHIFNPDDLKVTDYRKLMNYGELNNNIKHEDLIDYLKNSEDVLAMRTDQISRNLTEENLDEFINEDYTFKFSSTYGLTSIGIGIGSILAYFVILPLVILLFATPFMILSQSLYYPATITLTVILYFLLSIVLFAVYEKKFYFQLKRIKFSKYFSKTIIYILIMYAILIFFGMIGELVSNLAGVDSNQVSENQQSLESISSSIPIFIFVIYTCAAAPIFEELLFRFILIDKILGWVKNKYVQILISTFIFVLLHTTVEFFALVSDYSFEGLISTIVIMLGYLGMSLVFSYVYVVERNIYLAIILHMFNNIVATVLMLTL